MPNSLYYGDNRTVETTLNVHLADLLRNQGLDASADVARVSTIVANNLT